MRSFYILIPTLALMNTGVSAQLQPSSGENIRSGVVRRAIAITGKRQVHSADFSNSSPPEGTFVDPLRSDHLGSGDGARTKRDGGFLSSICGGLGLGGQNSPSQSADSTPNSEGNLTPASLDVQLDAPSSLPAQGSLDIAPDVDLSTNQSPTSNSANAASQGGAANLQPDNAFTEAIAASAYPGSDSPNLLSVELGNQDVQPINTNGDSGVSGGIPQVGASVQPGQSLPTSDNSDSKTIAGSGDETNTTPNHPLLLVGSGGGEGGNSGGDNAVVELAGGGGPPNGSNNNSNGAVDLVLLGDNDASNGGGASGNIAGGGGPSDNITGIPDNSGTIKVGGGNVDNNSVGIVGTGLNDGSGTNSGASNSGAGGIDNGNGATGNIVVDVADGGVGGIMVAAGEAGRVASDNGGAVNVASNDILDGNVGVKGGLSLNVGRRMVARRI